MIPQNFIDDIQSRTDIVEVISGYIPVKRSGRNFKALCPFHGEKSPSFMISPQKQIFHCFGCSEGGGALQFLMKYEKVTFVEAVEILAKRLGVDVPKQNDDKSKLKNVLYEAVNEASIFFHKNLLSDNASPLMSYLAKRGISKETVEKFRIGYAPGRNGLTDYLRKKNFTLETLEKASLVIPAQNGYRDLFIDRITFPIFDVRSRVVGFGARIYTEKKDAPKYINSLENPLYSKREQLFGLNFAKDEIIKNDLVIIVEGYMDMIIPYIYGVKNIVASSGTALTIEQINIIRRYTNNVVLLFDSDRAGQLATLRALDLLLENELKVKIVQLPSGFDPDLLVRQYGKDFFQALIEKRQDFFDYKINILKGLYDGDSIDGKTKIVQELFITLAKLKSEVEKYEYIKKLSDNLKIKEEILIAEFRKLSTQNNYKRSAIAGNIGSSDKVNEPLSLAEKILLKFMFTNGKAFMVMKKNLNSEDFNSAMAKKCIDYFFTNCSDPKEQVLNNLIASIEDKLLSSFVSQIILDDNIPQDNESFKASVMKLRSKKKFNLKEKIRQEIGEAEKNGDRVRVRELITKFGQIKTR